MGIVTADIWDAYTDKVTYLHLDMRSFGKVSSFEGEIITLKLHEDNTFVRTLLSENGKGKVLVVDGGGSKRCALVGDNIARLAMDNQWSGVVVYGCIRDSKEINDMAIGIKALGTCPVKSIKRQVGLPGEDLLIEGTLIKQGQYLYSDEDGILIADSKVD